MQGISSSGARSEKETGQADIPPLRGFEMQKTARCPAQFLHSFSKPVIISNLFQNNADAEQICNLFGPA